MEAYITRRHDDYGEVRFPFDASIVASLKASIPPKRRSWSSSEKCWLVHRDYIGQVYELLHRRFGEVIVTDAAAPPPRRPAPIRQSDPYLAELHLLPSAPKYVVEAVYRAMARQHHPDKLPVNERAAAHERMTAINRAYQVVRDRVAS